jgi:large conductance mechanosensitive channel
MKLIKEFKAFISRGNVIDLAVGVIIGGAFGKIVSSLVNDIIMPLIGIILGGVSFSDLSVTLIDGKFVAGAVEGGATIAYGMFIQNIIDFLIIALCVFLIIKLMSAFKKKKEEVVVVAKVEPTKEEQLLTEIRDLLKEKK